MVERESWKVGVGERQVGGGLPGGSEKQGRSQTWQERAQYRPRRRGAASRVGGEQRHCRGDARWRRERGDEVREVLVGGVGPMREVTSKSAILYKPERVMNYPV